MLGLETTLPLSSLPSRNHSLALGSSFSMALCSDCTSPRLGSAREAMYALMSFCTLIPNPSLGEHAPSVYEVTVYCSQCAPNLDIQRRAKRPLWSWANAPI